MFTEPIQQSEFIMKDFRIDTYNKSTNNDKNNIIFLNVTHSTLNKFHRPINFLTDPITLNVGSGIFDLDNVNNSRGGTFFWLVLNKCEGGTDLFNRIISQIDYTCIKKINEGENKWGFIKYDTQKAKTKKGEITTHPFENLNYIPMAKLFNNKNESNIRIKIIFDTFKNPFINSNCKNTIYTSFFTPTEQTKTKPKNQKIFKRTPEIIKNISDIKKIFHVGCTCQFNIILQSFWIDKKLSNDNKYNCGIILKCTQIFILDDPIWYNPNLNQNIESNSDEYDGKYGEIKSIPKKLII